MLSSLVGFSLAAQAGLEAEPAAAEAHQRLRAGAAALDEAVAGAGAAFFAEPDRAPGHGLPALVPAAALRGAWPAAVAGGVVTTLASARSAARGRLAAAAPAGAMAVALDREPLCPPATPTCGFAAGDAVVLYDAAGALVLAGVRSVDPPLVLTLDTALPVPLAAGAWAAQADIQTFALRAAADGGQLTRARDLGAALPVIDQVRRFDVEWWGVAGAPRVLAAADGTPGRTTAGPLPPPPGEMLPWGAWPAGENCLFAGDGAGGWAPRLADLGSGLVPVPLDSLQDGPWCPHPAAPGRWDADLLRLRQVRVRLAVQAAAERLRAPGPASPGPRARRTVPDIEATLVLVPGRWRGERR